MSENRIRVTYFNPLSVSENPYLLAGVGFHIVSMDMYLAKCKLIRKKDSSLYIAPPSEEYMDNKTGKKAWSNFFWFGEKSSSFFQTQAIRAIKDYCLGKGITDPTISQPESNTVPSESIHLGDNVTQNKPPQQVFHFERSAFEK